MSGFLAHYRRGLGTALRHNQVAYGYSATITAIFGAVSAEDRAPSVADCFLYVAGAGAAFALANTLITRGFERRLPREPSEVVALGTAFSALSMGSALGAAALVAWGLGSWGSWALSPFAGTVAFVALSGLEMALAGRHHDAGGVGGDFDG